MRDTFYTINYYGVYIHSCFDRNLNSEIFTVNRKEFKSLHAAKLAATRHIKEHNKKMKIFVAGE